MTNINKEPRVDMEDPKAVAAYLGVPLDETIGPPVKYVYLGALNDGGPGSWRQDVDFGDIVEVEGTTPAVLVVKRLGLNGAWEKRAFLDSDAAYHYLQASPALREMLRSEGVRFEGPELHAEHAHAHTTP